MARLAHLLLAAFALSLCSATFASTASHKPVSLPLTFEKNHGQAAAQYEYLLRHAGIQALFSPDGVDFLLPGKKGQRDQLGLEFISENSTVKLIPEGSLQAQSNYLLGPENTRWITHVPNYARIRYQNLYPGVHLDFYGNGSYLEHDFVIAAGTDPSSIAFRLKGAEHLGLTPAGDLKIQIGTGIFILKKPAAYQGAADRRNPIDAAFLLATDGTVGFRVGSYDTSQPLIIDPVFTFSTYLDGTGADNVTAVTTDSIGNIYITGYTSSTDFPTKNAAQTGCSTAAGCPDVFITKLDPTGHTLIYSTYLGGSGQDYGAAIAVDSNGDAIVGGVADDTDFPHAGSVPSLSCQINDYCYFVASLKPDGSAFNYSGQIGGSQGEYANSNNGRLAVDTSGNAYLAGITDDPNFQITSGTLSSTVPGYTTTFVLKVDPTGKLIYSTVIPGNTTPDPTAAFNNWFLPSGIIVDSLGQVSVAGTAGLGLPTTAGVLVPSFPNAANGGNATAGFVLQLNSSASAINYATYVPGTDTLGGMAVDNNENVYVTGGTSESTLPVSPNAYQKALTPGPNCTCNAGYIVKLNAKGTSVLAATYLSGTPPLGNEGTSFTGIALDKNSNVFVGGETGSADFPLQDPFTTILELSSSAWDMVLAEMSPDLSSLTFGSFLNSTDSILSGSIFSSLAVDPSDNLIVVGTTLASDFPTTSGAFQTQPPPPPNPQVGYLHTFISRIDIATPAPSACFDTFSISFGTSPANTPTSQTLHVTNCGDAPLSLTSITPSDSTVVASQSCGSIAARAVCPVTLTFTPVNSNAVSGTITISDNAVITPQVVSFSGQGQAPNLVVSPDPASYGHLLVGTQGPNTELVLWNQGTAPLSISNITVSGSSFSLASNECPTSVQPRSSCTVQVVFSPAAAGPVSGALNITSNDPVNPQLAVTLTGTGDSAYGMPAIGAVYPPTVQVNSGTVTLQVSGSNFYPTSTVQVNGAALPTTFGSNTTLSAVFSTSTIAALGESPITVVNPTPGGGTSISTPLTPYQSIPLSVASLVFEPNSKRMFAAIPAAASVNANTIIPIDPSTGDQGTPIAVGNDPEKLAVSADGSYLYVGLNGDHTLQRINLQTLVVEKTFPLPTDPSFGDLTVQDMKVVPGSPQSVVVALFRVASPAEAGAALFNDSGLVNYIPDDYADNNLAVDSLTFASSPSLIYALPGNSTFFTELSLDSAGLHYNGASMPAPTSPVYGSIVVSDGTLLYTSWGQVWNPSSQKLLGTFMVPGGGPSITLNSIAPDPSVARVFALDPFTGWQTSQFGNYQALDIDAFDPTTYSLFSSLSFINIYPVDAFDVVRWGIDGFAFRVYDNTNLNHSADQIVLVRSSIVGQPVAVNPAPTLSSLSPASIAAGGKAFSLTVNGTGFLSTSIVDWNGTPLSTSYVSSTQLTASVPVSDIANSGTAQITVTNPAPGGGTSSAQTFTINAPVSVATPIFNPGAGTYTGTQSVTVTDATTGATIYYTTDGTTPTTSSNKYTGTVITVSSTETLEAIAVAGGYTNSAVAMAVYTIAPVLPTPSFSVSAGTYSTAQSVTISDATTGATIYYTTNGTTPTTSSTKYTGAITVGSTETLEAIAVAPNFTNSAVATALYTIHLPVAPTMTITPSSSSITTAEGLTVTVAVNGSSGNAVPAGTVTLMSGTYSAQQTLAAGSTTFSLAAGALPAGTDTLTSTYSPAASSAGTYTAATQSMTVTVSIPVGAGTAAISVTPSAATITDEQGVSVTVSVTGVSGQPMPTGSVALTSTAYNAQQQLISGTATFKIPAGVLSAGANTLTGSYSGDATYGVANGNTIITVSQVVLAVPAPSAVPPGNSATGTVTLSAGSNYSGTMNLTCALTTSPSGAQSLPTCSLKPDNVTIMAGGNGTAVLTVQTTAATTAALVQPFGQKMRWLGGGGTALAALLLFGIPAKRRRWMTGLALLLVIIAAGAIGCGGGGGVSQTTAPPSSSTPATTAGSYLFAVTGTDGANAKITTSANVTITVQ